MSNELVAQRALRAAVHKATDNPGEALVTVQNARVNVRFTKVVNTLELSPENARSFARGLLEAAAIAEAGQ